MQVSSIKMVLTKNDKIDNVMNPRTMLFQLLTFLIVFQHRTAWIGCSLRISSKAINMTLKSRNFFALIILMIP